MTFKAMLAIGLLSCVGAGAALGQTSSGPTPAMPNTSTTTTPPRNPMLGRPGSSSQPATNRPSASARAAAAARADKQPPGTENGNQPDRAAAGGGAR